MVRFEILSPASKNTWAWGCSSLVQPRLSMFQKRNLLVDLPRLCFQAKHGGTHLGGKQKNPKFKDGLGHPISGVGGREMWVEGIPVKHWLSQKVSERKGVQPQGTYSASYRLKALTNVVLRHRIRDLTVFSPLVLLTYHQSAPSHLLVFLVQSGAVFCITSNSYNKASSTD
jgi:hypothetical protein